MSHDQKVEVSLEHVQDLANAISALNEIATASMNYNASYFGEPQGYLKKSIRQAMYRLDLIASSVNGSAEPQPPTVHYLPTAAPATPDESIAVKSKPRLAFLELAEANGARITGKPDGSEAIEIIFSIQAWRAFDATMAQEGPEESTPAARDVLAERKRQSTSKGYSSERDNQYTSGELALAAALFAIPYNAMHGNEALVQQEDFVGLHMALELSCGWKATPEPDPRKRLVKAGALILAEIERIDRATGGTQ